MLLQSLFPGCPVDRLDATAYLRIYVVNDGLVSYPFNFSGHGHDIRSFWFVGYLDFANVSLVDLSGCLSLLEHALRSLTPSFLAAVHFSLVLQLLHTTCIYPSDNLFELELPSHNLLI